MPKITEYQKASGFDAHDVLLKDGINGTKKIEIEDFISDVSDTTGGTNGKLAKASDVTALDGKVTDLKDKTKEQITDVSGNIIYDNWVYDYRINTSGETVDLSGETANHYVGFAYQIVDCSEGDKFTLTGTIGNGAYRLWCWCKDDGEIVLRPNSNLNYNNEVIVCPENATKLLINTSTSGTYSLYGGEYLSEQVKDLYGKFDNVIDPDDYSGTDNEKIVAAMAAIGDSGHGIILIKRTYQLSGNIYITHLGNADSRLIFLGVGSNNPGFNMGGYGFNRLDGATSYGALSFLNILFKGTNNCNMFVADNILRVNFENCVFDGFKHIVYTTRYVQTYYFNDCLIRNGSDIAIMGNVSDTAPLIDVRLTNCVIEKSTHLLTGYGLHGVYITGCCIEGNDGYVIDAKGDCRDVVVDNCYFEAQNVGYAGGTDGNGMCFDFSGISGIVHNVSITNNMFGQLEAGNTIIMLPYRMMSNTVFTVMNNLLSPATSSDPNIEDGAYLVSVPNNAVNVYKNLRFDQNVRAKKYDPNHLIVDLKEANTSVASLLVTEYYMTHDDQGNSTTKYNPGYWYVCDDLNNLYAPGYYHISADIPIANSPVNDDFYLINMRTNETFVQTAMTNNGIMTRVGTGNWVLSDATSVMSETKLESLVEYWSDFDFAEINTRYVAQHVGVNRLGMLTEFTGDTSGGAVYVKLSKEIGRAGSISARNAFEKEITLLAGHRYSISAQIVGGSYSNESSSAKIYIRTYNVSNTALTNREISVASPKGIDFITPESDTLVNVVAVFDSGFTFTNLNVFVIIQDVTDAKYTTGVYADFYDTQAKVDDNQNKISKLTSQEPSKEYFLTGLPFYKIHAPFLEKRKSYLLDNDEWVDGEEVFATEIIKCPPYLMIYPKKTSSSYCIYVYIGDLVNGEFVVDETKEFSVGSSNIINRITVGTGFSTCETSGNRYMWLGSNSNLESGYDDAFDVIGADYWPESPVNPLAWTTTCGAAGSYSILKSNTDKAGYYLPEKAWLFVRGLNYSIIHYGIGADSSHPWSSRMPGVSAFYIPEGSGMPMLTVNQDDVVTKNNVCIVPEILDKCISSNAIKAERLAEEVLTKFRYTGKSSAANIGTNTPIVVGKLYHTIPYTSKWHAQHFVCFDTTPETAANAANDEYSVFYDATEGRSELDSNGRPGYGGVCSIWASLAMGSPYPQTTDGFMVDQNFVVTLYDNPRSGDVCMSKVSDEDGEATGHVLFVEDVYKNGYSILHYMSPGIIQAFHTAKETVPFQNYRVSLSYLDSYNYKVASKDRSGWETNYLNFDYEIANGSIRPWRGNKSVCSNYNKMTTPASSISMHTGIHITVHDNATTAYIKKPGGTILSLDVTGQTVVNIGDYVDEVGTYELYSNVSDTREFFRYFEHDPVTLHLEEDGTAVFSSDDVDYAYVWTYGAPTGYPDHPTATVTLIAKGVKYPGIVIRGIKSAVVRDTTMINGVEDSWGRYPVVCTAI